MTATLSILERTILETVAIGVAIKDKDLTTAKKSLPVGNFPVDVTVRINGSISKGEDTVGIIPQRAKPWALLAVALCKLNGVTISSIVREAESLTEETEEKMKEDVMIALQELKGKTTGTISGKTTSRLEVTLIATNGGE